MEHVVIEYGNIMTLPKAANGQQVVHCNFGSTDIVAEAERVARNVARQFGSATVRPRKTDATQFRVFHKTTNITLAIVKPCNC